MLLFLTRRLRNGRLFRLYQLQGMLQQLSCGEAGSIVIMGGTTEKHPFTKRMMLVGEVFQFNLNTLKWSVIGRLPYRVKTTQAAFWNGWLYFTSGQRDRGPDNPQPRQVVGEMWRTKLELSSD
nr:kelch repeat-containing protein At3g27220-like [Ipomoea batatas]